MTDQATPRPWTAEKQGCVTALVDGQRRQVAAAMGDAPMHGRLDIEPQVIQQANADLICRAVNALDDMVTFLDDVDEYLRANVPSDGWGIRDRGADSDREALRGRIAALLEKAKPR